MFVVQSLYSFDGQDYQQKINSQPSKEVQKQQTNVQQQQIRNSKQLPQIQQPTQQCKQQTKQTNHSIAKIQYLSFKPGQKIVVKNTYPNGWWYGTSLDNNTSGFFPSNFVQLSVPPPPPQQQNQLKRERDQKQLKQLEQKAKMGAMPSQYYQGITGYKRIKIDEKNQNILRASFVKVDKQTGMALIPIKDQDPASKAVRHMGYYFDYHQWIDKKNKGGQKKRKGEKSRKKQKQLKLKLK